MRELPDLGNAGRFPGLGRGGRARAEFETYRRSITVRPLHGQPPGRHCRLAECWTPSKRVIHAGQRECFCGYGRACPGDVRAGAGSGSLEIIGWYDDVQADDVRRAVLTLSQADMDALLSLVAAAVAGFRDVLTWASEPEPAPEERAAARAGIRAMVRGHDQARRQYLEASYGIEGATQIEQSNMKLLGKPPPSDHDSGAG